MCTAVIYRGENNFFGRTLDLEYHYHEEVVMTPREWPLHLRYGRGLARHYAYIGMASMAGDTPLYYDGMSEMGVAAAALRFADYAHYTPHSERIKEGLAAFEVLPFLLSLARSAREGVELLSGRVITDLAYDEAHPTTPLHWMIADAKTAYVIEPLASGVSITENPLGVLTNAPDFASQMRAYKPYAQLTPAYRSRAAQGLPGNWTSAARFVRAAYLNTHLAKGDEKVYFRMMDSLAVPPGASITEGGKETETIYTSCCNLETGEYFYHTRQGRKIRSHRLGAYCLDGSEVQRFPLLYDEK